MKQVSLYLLIKNVLIIYGGLNVMENEVLNEVVERLNIGERIVVKIFTKTFKKVYKLGMIDCFNYYNK